MAFFDSLLYGTQTFKNKYFLFNFSKEFEKVLFFLKILFFKDALRFFKIFLSFIQKYQSYKLK